MKTGAKVNTLKFAIGLELVKTEDATSGRTIVIPLGQSTGRQGIAQVILEKGTASYQDQYKIPFGMVYPVWDERVSDVPRNVEAAELVGADKPNPAAPVAPPPKED